MATNAIKYISNVGKSMGYATVDVLKEMNPSVTSFIDTNNDALKTTYSAIKNIKSTSKSIYDKAVTSRYGELAKNLKKNIFEDIKTGKIYNKERVEKAESAAAMNMLGADEDFDFSFDDDSSSDDDFDFGNDDLMNKMDDVGEKTSTAISTVVARSAEYQVRATKELGNVIYNQNASIYAGLHANMKTINENISTLINFASGPVQTHLGNSKTFYETETRLSEERNSILKEMLELQKAYYKPQATKTNNSTRMRISDVVDSEGMVDFSQYFKAIKQNAKRNSSGTGDMIDMLFESGAIDSMIASPLEFIAKGAVKSLMPKMLKKSMEEFNKVLSGAFSSLMMNISKMDDYGPAGVIKNLFGIDVAEKKKIDTGKYEKGAVPFDGITRKSIVEVIPTYLSQIASALTGMEENRYDYESGKFVDVKDIQKMLDLKNQRYSEQANYDLKEEIQKYTKSLDYEKSGIDKKQFEKDLQKILDDSYKNGKLFNSRDSKKTSKDYGLSGGKKSDLNLEVIREIFERIGQNRPGTPIQWAGNMQSTKDYQFRDMEQEEASGTSLLAALYNDSIKKSSNSKKSAAAPGRKSVYSDIYDEVVKIRKILESRGTDEPENKGFINKNLHKNSKDDKKSTDKATNKSQSTTQKTEENTINNKDALEIAKAGFDKVDAEDDSKISSSFESLFDEVKDADTAGGKFKAALKIPSRFVTILLKKGQNNFYDLIFGKPENKKSKFRKEIDDLGLGPAIMGRLNKIFENFNNWLKDNILNPLKERFNFDNIGKFFGDLFDRLGIKDKFNSIKDRTKANTKDFRERFASSIKDPFKRAKDKASDTIKEFVTDEGASVKEQNEKIQEALNNLHGAGKIDNAAKGIKRVTKTGIVAVSEGEMIIPASLNPFDVKRNLKKENKAKEDFISNFAEGGTVGEEDVAKYIELANRLSNVNKKEGKSKFRDDLGKALSTKLEKSKKDPNDKKNWKSRDILGESIDYLGKGILNLADEVNRLAGGDKKSKDKAKDIEKEKEGMLSTAFGELKKFAPEAAAGGVIGAGVSFLPGIIGGPVLGAAVGAGVSLISHSDKIKKMLFGDDKDKGLLPENLSKNIQKYGKSMGIGAIAGSLGGLLHIIPGGPVAGVILGSAVGFAKNNDKIQEKLFGEKGMLGKNFKDKVKKALPGMGAGALVGALAGPFGIGTNILLGSAVGFATTTDTFKDAFFGKKNEKTGEREGGVFKNMVDNLILPLKDFAFETKDKMADWAKKYILQPLKDAVDPAKKQMELMFKEITGFFKGAIDRVFDDKIGTPFEKFLKDKVFKPSTKFIKGFISGALAPVKFVASLPGRGLNAVSNHYRTKHINEGNADYMTAGQRLLYRKSRGTGILGRRFKRGEGSDFTKYDETIYKMNDKQVSSTRKILSDVLDKEKEITDPTNNDAYNKFDYNIRKNKNLDYKQTRKIISQIKKTIKGSKSAEDASKKISKILANSDLSDEDKRQIAQTANEYLAEIDQQLKAKSELSDKKKVIMDKLGIKDESHLPKFVNLLKAEENSDKQKIVEEDKAKTPEERFNDWEEARHDETISKLGQIRDSIMALNINDPEAKQKFLDKSMKKYNAIDKEVSARKDFIKKVKETVKEEREKNKKEEQEAKDKKNAKNKGLKNKLKGNKTIDWRNPDDYDALTGRRLDSQVDDNGDSDIKSEGFKLSSKMKNKAKEAYYTFYESKPIRYIRDSKGKLTKDTGDSETRKTVDGIEREKIEKRKFFEDGIPLFSAIKEKFFNKKKNKSDDEDDEGNDKPGFFRRLIKFLTGKSKVGKLAKTAGLLFGVPLLVSVWSEKIWPTLEPLLGGLGETVSSGVTVLWDKAKEWLTGEGGSDSDGKAKGLPGIMQKAFEFGINHWANGLEIILTKVIPKTAEIIVSCLPTALGNLGKGIIKGFSMSIDSILNAGKPSTNSDDIVEQYTAVTSDSLKLKEMQSGNIGSSNDSITGNVDFSAWSLSGVLDFLSKGTVSSTTQSPSTVDNKGNTLVTTSNPTEQLTKENGILTYSTKNSKVPLTREIRQGSNVYTTNKNTLYTTNNGDKSETYTLDELLKYNGVVGYVTDQDGNEIAVKGTELLNYPDLAKQLGISSRRLTEEEKQANADNMGLSRDHTLGKTYAAAAGRAFLRGSTKPGNMLGSVAKAAGKVPIFGKYLQAPLSVAAKGVKGAGKLGDKILPEFLTGNYTQAVKNSGGGVLDNFASLITKNSGKDAAKYTQYAIQEAGGFDHFVDYMGKNSPEVLQQLKNTGGGAVTKKIEESIANSGTGKLDTILSQLGKASGKDASKLTQDAIKEAGGFDHFVEYMSKNNPELLNTIKGNSSDVIKKKIEESVKSTAADTITNAAKNSADDVVKNVVKDGADDAMKAAAEKVEKESSDGVIKRIINWVTTKASSFFGSSKVASYFQKASEQMGKLASKETCEAATKELAEKITAKLAKVLPKKLAEGGGKAVAKATSAIATAGVTTVAFALAAFIKGWKNANNYIGVATDVKEAGGLTKLICAIVNTLNEVYCFGLIPISTIFDWVLPWLKKIPMFSEKAEEIEKDREESAQLVGEFNEKNGTNLTVEEYNKARKRGDSKNPITNSSAWQYLFGKGASIDKDGNYQEGKKGKVQEIGGNIKNFFMGNEKTGEKNLGGKIKDVGSKAGSYITEKVSDISDTLKKLDTGIKNFASTTKDMCSASMSWALTKTDKSASESIKVDDDDPLANYVKIGAKVTDTIVSPLRFVVSSGKKVVEELTPIFRFVKALAGKVKDYASEGLSDAWKGDISNYMNFSDDEDSGNELSPLKKLVKGVTRSALLPVAAVTAGVGAVGRLLKSFLDTGKNVVSNVFTTEKELISSALHGELGISDVLNISGENDGEGIIKYATMGVRAVTRVNLLIPALLGTAGHYIVEGLSTVIDSGKQAVTNLADSEKNLFMEAAQGKVGLSEVFNVTGHDDGTGPLSWITKGVRGGIRFITGPTALIVSGISNVVKGVESVMSSGASSLDYVTTEYSRLSKYASGDTKSLDGFWKNETKVPTDGIFNKIAYIVNKVMKVPMFIVSVASMMASKLTDWAGKLKDGILDKWDKIKKFFGSGADDLESEDGSGSGLVRSKSAIINQKAPKNNLFISQIDNVESNKRFNTSKDTTSQTLADSGCAPASAAMVINSMSGSGTEMTMGDAAVTALNYKQKNGGVTADYFGDIFAQNGIRSQYITQNSPGSRNTNITNNLRNNNKVVLMGKDSSNTSKNNSPFGPNSHYVVANGISDDGNYMYINDPESNTPNRKYSTKKVLSGTKIGIAASIGGKASGLIRRSLKRFSGRGSISASQYMHENLGSWSPISVDEMAAWINRVSSSSSPWRNNKEAAKVFVDAGNQSGLDPRYILAHAAVESGWGTSKISRDKNNYFGIGAFDSSPYASAYSFGSGLAAGIIGGAKWIRKNYYDAGQTTVYLMNNDPTGKGHNYATAGMAWINSISQIMSSGPENKKFTTDKKSCAGAMNDSSSASTSDSSSSSSSGGTLVDKILGGFSKMAEAFGLTSSSDSTDTSSSSSGVSGGSDKQKALVQKMKSVEGKLVYSQTQRNPDTGSGDCSSTVQWAYKNVLGVDPGSWTGAQETDSDLYTVTEGANVCIADESKLQPGDLVLYRKGNTSTHVEMYAGDGKLIGHGGGPHGTTKGPTIKPLNTKFSSTPVMVRRWVGFKGGSGSGLDTASYSQTNSEIKNGTFISQLDYDNKFNTSKDTTSQTLADSGCAPASAAMVLNSFKNADNKRVTMQQASAPALKYKVENGGVTADYFGDMFEKNGLQSRYIMDSDPNTRATNIATSLYNDNKVVLMGEDSSNTSKKNSPFGPNAHYVVATKMSPDGKYIYINDPESKKPEVAYPAQNVLSSAQIGIAASAANGSGLIRDKLRKYSGRGSYGPGTIQYKVWTKIRGAGYNEIATAALMGNIQHESGFNASAIEKGNGVGLGLIQWSYGRRTALENYARSKGKSASDVDIQIEYLLKELDAGSGIWTAASSRYGFGSLSRNDWANGKDIEKATKAFMCCFERPSYSASVNHIDRRIQSAKEYLQAFAGISGDSSSSSSSDSDSSSDSSSTTTTSFIDKVLSGFNKLASAWGVGAIEDTSSTDSSSSSSSSTSGGSDKQQALVDKMKSVQGKLKYSNTQRNPDTGSGDCSSTVQWAYQKVLGVDPGSTTMDQEVDNDLYTVAQGYDSCISDESKLQPGDLILYRKGGKSWHVEMYAGNGQIIGHGGGPNGTKMGPVINKLHTNMGSTPYMVRRWVGFKGGSGSGLDTGIFDSDGAFSKQTLRKAQSNDWIVNNQQKVSIKDISKFKERQINAKASLYSGSGSNIAPGRSSTQRLRSNTDLSNIMQALAFNSTSRTSGDSTSNALLNIVSLLTQIVDNTSNLKAMVSLLSEIISIMNEESTTPKTKENEQKIQALSSKKESLFSKLNSYSGENESVSQLIQNAERLARV